MKLDLTIIKNETLLKFSKSIIKVRKHFDDLLAISLETANYEIDQEKKDEVEIALNDLFNDEFNKMLVSFTGCLNKASHLVENRLGDAHG